MLVRTVHTDMEVDGEEGKIRVPQEMKRLLILDYFGDDDPSKIWGEDAEANQRRLQCYSQKRVKAAIKDKKLLPAEKDVFKRVDLYIKQKFAPGMYPPHYVLISHTDSVLSARHGFPFDCTLMLQCVSKK